MNWREEEYHREWLNLGECLLAVKIPIATNSTSKNKKKKCDIQVTLGNFKLISYLI